MKYKIKVGDKVRNTYHFDDKHWPKGHEFIVERLILGTGQELDSVEGKTADGQEGGLWLRDCELVATKEELETGWSELKTETKEKSMVNFHVLNESIVLNFEGKTVTIAK